MGCLTVSLLLPDIAHWEGSVAVGPEVLPTYLSVGPKCWGNSCPCGKLALQAHTTPLPGLIWRQSLWDVWLPHT